MSEEPAIAESDDSNYEAQEAESEPNNNNGDAEKRKKLDGGKKKEEGKDATYRLQGKDGCEVDC